MDEKQAHEIINKVRWEWAPSVDDLLRITADELAFNLDYQPVEGVTFELLVVALATVRAGQEQVGRTGMKPREAAILIFSRDMVRIDQEYTVDITDATRELLAIHGPITSEQKSVETEESQIWQRQLWQAFHRWDAKRRKLWDELDAALAADPAIES